MCACEQSPFHHVLCIQSELAGTTPCMIYNYRTVATPLRRFERSKRRHLRGDAHSWVIRRQRTRCFQFEGMPWRGAAGRFSQKSSRSDDFKLYTMSLLQLVRFQIIVYHRKCCLQFEEAETRCFSFHCLQLRFYRLTDCLWRRFSYSINYRNLNEYVFFGVFK
jgi:hypothetical protein